MMFYRDRLRQARELRGLRQSELAELVSKSQGTIANIESGLSEPPAELLAALAKSTGFPLSFFSTDPPIEFPAQSLMFRARVTMTRRDAVAACRFAEIVYELMVRTLENYVEQLPVGIRRAPSASPIIAAQETRRLMGLSPDAPIKHVINSIEANGVLVLALPFEFKKIDAFSAWVGTQPQRPVIGICKVHAGDRMRWSISHELGHIILHSHLNQLRAHDHRHADQFAAEFLLPEVAMRQELTAPVTLSSVAALKPKWGVAMQSLVRRAFELGIIPERQYRHLFEEIGARGWRMKEPSNLDIPIEKPRALRQIAELAFGHPVNFAHLATESHLTVEMVKQILAGYEEASKPARLARSGNVIQLKSVG
jgi:Zn-dependent peptidase ImmA (M78 family)/transcriptional regulator with XRE-family HTH domain